MPTRVRSFSKINLGLAIGPVRGDGFHGLTTMYQTLALHDFVTVRAVRCSETRISLTTNHQYVPADGRNTAWKMVERCLVRLGVAAEVAIYIDKRLPVQGGLGAGSGNAAAAMLALEKELGVALPEAERLELAAEVGSDVPLFLVGGAVRGTGRGEKVRALPDLPEIACVVAVPTLGVSTPQAFRDWDARVARLTAPPQSDRLNELSLAPTVASPKTDSASGTSGISRGDLPDELSFPSARDLEKQQGSSEQIQNGVRDDLAENSLLALVRTGTENDLSNDFEDVVFPQYPSLRDLKRELMGSETGGPALYAALSGSGSALFGLYRSTADARAAQLRVQGTGVRAMMTTTLPRAVLWSTMFAE